MVETSIGSMPALLGAGSEFITDPNIPIMFNSIIDLDQLSADTVLAGHIIGGIESSAANIFFINTGTQSAASTRVFRVLLVRDVNAGIIDQEKDPLSVTVSLNNEGNQLLINVDLLSNGVVEMNILDSTGKLVRAVLNARVPSGPQQFIENVKDLTAGVYYLDLVQGDQRNTVRFIR